MDDEKKKVKQAVALEYDPDGSAHCSPGPSL